MAVWPSAAPEAPGSRGGGLEVWACARLASIWPRLEGSPFSQCVACSPNHTVDLHGSPGPLEGALGFGETFFTLKPGQGTV